MSTVCDTRPQDSIGTTTVEKITQGRAKHGWQTFDPRNDNGVDGMIILRKVQKGANTSKGQRLDTGELIFAQVKCGSPGGYYKEAKKRPKHFGVNVGKEYIDSHKEKWRKLFGPVILIYVDYKTEKAWWTDLKDENSFSMDNKALIIVPKQQRFGIHSFGEFKRLKGYLHINPEIQTIEAGRKDVNFFPPSIALKQAAKDYYRSWANSQDRNNPELGEVTVSREGWRHICRKGRKNERIVQSWSLLGIARKITNEVTRIFQLRVEKTGVDGLGNFSVTDYISLRAQVIFPQRHSSVVQVVLKRRRKFDNANNLLESKIWFHSVFEPMAKKVIR